MILGEVCRGDAGEEEEEEEKEEGEEDIFMRRCGRGEGWRGDLKKKKQKQLFAKVGLSLPAVFKCFAFAIALKRFVTSEKMFLPIGFQF